jgi:AcrR family transcriptional regulator
MPEIDDETARTRVLDAAEELFYEHGIRGVGMDQIRDVAGVSLKRLYRLFPGKDQLAEAVLRRRDRRFQEALVAYTATRTTPRDKVAGVFDFLHESFEEPGYRGCPFINAYGEMSSSSPGVAAAVEAQKRSFHGLLTDLVDAAGGPAEAADQLFILANGAMVAAAVLRSPDAALEARVVALRLLDEPASLPRS